MNNPTKPAIGKIFISEVPIISCGFVSESRKPTSLRISWPKGANHSLRRAVCEKGMQRKGACTDAKQNFLFRNEFALFIYGLFFLSNINFQHKILSRAIVSHSLCDLLV